MTDRDKNFFMTTEDSRSMFDNMESVWAAAGSSLNAEDIAIQLSTSGQFKDKDDMIDNIR